MKNSFGGIKSFDVWKKRGDGGRCGALAVDYFKDVSYAPMNFVSMTLSNLGLWLDCFAPSKLHQRATFSDL